jgi:hypothetical protein
MKAMPALFVTLLGACASHGSSSVPAALRAPARAASAEVLFDLAATCPRISIDRGARQFLAAVTERPEELGTTSATRSTLVVGRRAAQGAALAWHHDLGPDTTSFELSEGRLGEGVAIAGAARAPIPFVGTAADARWRGLFVLSFAPDGTLRFGRWIEAGSALTSSEEPRVTAAVSGPRSEVTLAGTTHEPLDFGGVTLRPGKEAYDNTVAFVVQYASNGVPAFATSRPAKLGTSPRLVARPDGALVMGFEARDGSPRLEAFEPTGPRGVGHRLPVTLEGTLGALAAAGPHDVIAATQSRDEGGTPTELRIARVAATGEIVWSRIMHGELQDGALAVTASGNTWFSGWFEGDPTGCVSAPLEVEHESVLPRLQLIDASGARCRSLPASTRTARWSTPASLLETAAGRMTFAAPLAGTATLPGIRAQATPLATRCVAVTLPTEAPEYLP